MEQNQIPQLRGSSSGGVMTVRGIRFVGGTEAKTQERFRLMRKYDRFRDTEDFTERMDGLKKTLEGDGFVYQDHSLSFAYSSWVREDGVVALVFWTRMIV